MNTAGVTAGMLGKDKLSGGLGVFGNFLGFANGLHGAADETKSTGERVLSGADAASNGAGFLAAAGGAPGAATLGAMELGTGALSATGGFGMLAAGGMVLGAGVAGVKGGQVVNTLADSKLANRANLGVGEGKTASDFWTDTAVGINNGADKAGDRMNDAIDAKGRQWGNSIDETLGGGGGVVSTVMDYTGGAVDFLTDTAGDIGGAATQLTMGTAARFADAFGAAGVGLGDAASGFMKGDPNYKKSAAEQYRSDVLCGTCHGGGSAKDGFGAFPSPMALAPQDAPLMNILRDPAAAPMAQQASPDISADESAAIMDFLKSAQ